MNTNEILRVLASSSDGVFAVGADNKILYCNKSTQSILGYKAKEMLGKSYKEIIPAKDTIGHPARFRNYGLTKGGNDENSSQNYEILTCSKKANRIWLSISVFDVPSTQSEYGMSVYIFRDITKQKIYEKIIKEVITRTAIADQLETTVPNARTSRDEKDFHARLTSREREVLMLLADGHSTKFVSRKLYIALSTLRKHIRNIYSKLQAHNMLEAVAKARKSQFI